MKAFKWIGVSLISVVALVLTGCISQVAGSTSPQIISGSEVLQLFESTFPNLRVGESLFITTGEYEVFTLDEIQQVLLEIFQETQIPPCRFKAATVYLGELHQRLGSLIAAGYAMTDTSPPWLIIFLAIDCNNIKIFAFDPADPGEPLQNLPNDSIQLILF